MKFKQQEDEKSQNNSFLNSVIDLICIVQQFCYAIDNFPKACEKMKSYSVSLRLDYNKLKTLAISLNPEHKAPTIELTLTAVNSINDLKILEEKYYNMLKEIGKKALEQNEIEVVSYLSDIIPYFKHYFCTLNEDNDSRETSS
jgi:hypothetical protein